MTAIPLGNPLPLSMVLAAFLAVPGLGHSSTPDDASVAAPATALPSGFEVGPFPHNPTIPDGPFETPPIVQWVKPLPGTQIPAASRSEFGRPHIEGSYAYVGAAGADALFRIQRDDGALAGQYRAAGPVKTEAVTTDDRLIFSDGAGYTWCYPLGVTPPEYDKSPVLPGRPLPDDDPPFHIWQHYAGAPILARPVVATDRVFITAVDNMVHVLDLATGSVIWRYQHPQDLGRESELELFGSPPPVVWQDLVLVGFHDGRLVGLDRDGGALLWEKRVGEGTYPDLIGEPLVVDGVAYLGGFSEPYLALDLETQTVKWRLDFGTAAPASESDHTLYVGGTDGQLRALDKATGTIIWTWDSESPGALTQPLPTDLGLMVGSSDGGLWLVDTVAGTTRWHLDAGYILNGISVAPAISGPQMLVLSNAGNVLSLLSLRPDQEPPLLGREQPWPTPFSSSGTFSH